MAQTLGAGLGAEAFRAALKIPNLLQNLLGEGVLSASFIPSYGQLLAEGRHDDARRLAGAVAGFLLVIVGVLGLIGVVGAEVITRIVAAGFPPGSEKYELTVRLVRILTPGVGFLVLSAWCLGVLNTHRRFFLSYVAPVLWNAAMIAALVGGALAGLGEADLAVALAWGTTIGGAAQLGVQLPTVRRLVPGLRFSLDRGAPRLKRVVRAFGPVVAGRGVVQLSAYLDLLLASFLASSAVAALGYAQTLYVLPISLFGMAMAAAELPELATLEPAERDVLGNRLDAGLSRMAWYVVPSMFAYLLLGPQLVALLFGGGQFDPRTAVQVGLILSAFAPGLLPATGSRLVQSALFGLGDTRTPALVAGARVALSTVVGVVLMLQLDQVEVTASGGLAVVGDLPSFSVAPEALRVADENLARLGAAGLALGTACGSWLEWVLLRRALHRRTGARPRLGGGRLARTLLAGGVAGGLAWAVPDRGAWGTVAALAVLAVVHLGLSRALSLEEGTALAGQLRRSVRRGS